MSLRQAGDGQIRDHDDHSGKQKPVRPVEHFRVIARPRNSLPRVDQSACRGEAGESEHGQMRMADHPVREMHALIDGHLGLHRALDTDDQVEHGSRAYEAQGDVARKPARSSQRQEQIRDHDHHVHAEQCRGRDGPDLRAHRNDGKDVVVRAVQRIEEEQQPESQHRQEMAEDRPARRGRNHEIENGHAPEESHTGRSRRESRVR